VTLVLAMGTSLPLLLPFQCALGVVSHCVASCCMYPTVFFSQDLRDDALASLGTSSSVSENHLKCVPRFRQLDPNHTGKSLVRDGEANICELACDRHDVCNLQFHGVQVAEGDGE
jgi:hypothetical protein